MTKESKTLSTAEVIESINTVLRECFLGAKDNGAFLDPGPNGLLDLLGSLSAEEASASVAGTSIATHAYHVAFSLDVFTEWLEGVRDKQYDWSQSWTKDRATKQEWARLCDRIREHSDALEKAIGTNGVRDAGGAWGAAGALAHTAYHLGALQVKFDELRKTE